jgi:DNA-binding transcriptional LysR family regulator
VVSATGGRRAIFDDLLSRYSLKRHALVSVSNFTAVPHLLARSDMIGVFSKLASDVFEKSFGLVTRRIPLDIGKIATNMVWHARSERDRKHAWLRQQIRAVYKDF